MFSIKNVKTAELKSFGVAVASVAGLMLLTSSPAEALTLSEYKGVAGDRMAIGKDMIQMFCWLMGTFLACVGLLLFWKNTKEQGRDHAKHGMIALLIAGALFSIPAIVDLSTDVSTGTADGKSNLQRKTL